MGIWRSWRSEGYPKAVFFHEHGMLSVLPSLEQFRSACRSARLLSVIRERAGPFTRRLFSAAAFRRAPGTRADPGAIVAEATIYRFGRARPQRAELDGELTQPHAARGGSRLETEALPPIDATLARLNEVDALRAVLMHGVVPVATLASLGLRVPPSIIANHLLAAPHPCEKAVWDVQLLHAEPDGLDLLEARVDEARRGRTLRGKILRTLGTRRQSGAHRFELLRRADPTTGEVRYLDAKLAAPGEEVVLGEAAWDRWYDHVLETVARARRFDYLVREQRHPMQHYPAPTLIQFLRLAAMLEPRHFEFFENRSLLLEHPEIGWPPDLPASPAA